MAQTVNLEDRARAIAETCTRFFAGRRDQRIAAAFLYGSVQTKAWRFDSDVDIAILDREEDRMTWKGQAALMDELERLTGQPIDLRMLRDCHHSHQVHILTSGVLMWVSQPSLLETYRESAVRRFQGDISRTHQTWVALLEKLTNGERFPRDAD